MKRLARLHDYKENTTDMLHDTCVAEEHPPNEVWPGLPPTN